MRNECLILETLNESQIFLKMTQVSMDGYGGIVRIDISPSSKLLLSGFVHSNLVTTFEVIPRNDGKIGH